MTASAVNNAWAPAPPVAQLVDVGLRYGKTHALDAISVELPASSTVGLIGPDGVGKSSMLALVAGARRIQTGRVEVLGGDMADAGHRRAVCPRIAYVAQGLGKNLYPTLSVFENVDFFGRLFGQDRARREERIALLLESTGLGRFADRPAGKLSGGMKQKLGLCCALIHDPDLLVLDEPTTGVDPLSRRQFWELIDRIRSNRPGTSVLAATCYLEEAARFDWLIAMNAGRVLATGPPAELLARTGSQSLEEAFIALLQKEKGRRHREIVIPPRVDGDGEVAIEARNLTRRFGNFVAVDHVSFQIERGEIFGFLGSNGCGKTTTMKMLCGLLPPTEGRAWLFGAPIDANDLATRRRVGYMSQAFSLYTELTVRQNLVLHARLFQMPEGHIAERVEQTAGRFDLTAVMDALPDSLPLGQRQRLSLAVALIHRPELLILDEPTSGVDPVARDDFWRLLIELSRRDQVTIFISTHFTNEAQRCDRISLMHAGKVLVSDKPAELVKTRGTATLDEAFIGYLADAAKGETAETAPVMQPLRVDTPLATEPHFCRGRAGGCFSIQRTWSIGRREGMELSRDPIRLTMAGLGSVILMIFMAYGMTVDVEHLNYAVLDLDETELSRDYALNIAGSSRWFSQRPPISDYAELDRRMRSGELSMVVEIPPRFGQHVDHWTQGDQPVMVGVWIDGAMPLRGETIRSYVQGMHRLWLEDMVRDRLGLQLEMFGTVELRYRYNADVRSLPAMVPKVIPLLLLLIPSMLSTLAVVQEKDHGSIINFYVTPTARLEFLLGKQLPYVALGFLNFLLLTALAVALLRVPLKGDFLTAAAGSLLYLGCATGIGLLVSTLTRTQMTALFATVLLTLIPAQRFCGLEDPVSALKGVGYLIGRAYPTSHYLTISRGVFNKALGFADLYDSFIPLLIAIPVLLGLSAALLKKQEG